MEPSRAVQQHPHVESLFGMKIVDVSKRMQVNWANLLSAKGAMELNHSGGPLSYYGVIIIILRNE